MFLKILIYGLITLWVYNRFFTAPVEKRTSSSDRTKKPAPSEKKSSIKGGEYIDYEEVE